MAGGLIINPQERLMSYFEDYKSERYHEKNLLQLIEYLDSHGKHAIINECLALSLPEIGKYISGFRKRDYDLHLEFEHAIICIATKVDSSENEYDDQPYYQTEKIYANYSQLFEKDTFFRYITYGASEFYIKRNEAGLFSTGPYSRHFKHISLSAIHRMIKISGILEEDDYSEIKRWKAYLEYEIEKRQNYFNMLKKIREFRLLYIGTSGLTDWPNNRINICLPEILLFFYSLIAHAWNLSDQKELFGGVTVYPVGRIGKVNDAILNFSELWDNTTLTFNGLIKTENAVYFEFNEDFNLHLKCCAADESDANIDALYEFVANRSSELSLNGKYNAIPERYKQSTYVLFEWDLGILDKIDNIDSIVAMISEIIGNAVEVLK